MRPWRKGSFWRKADYSGWHGGQAIAMVWWVRDGDCKHAALERVSAT